jgi:hypothetical protein
VNSEKLRELITRSEGGALEFKRSMYLLNHPDQDIKKRQKDEFIKDVLSLANGSASVAGETAYLIIGADDQVGAEGVRALIDVGDIALTGRQIRDFVNAACDPPLEHLIAETVELDGKRLFVITILPSPYLHETTRALDGPNHKFTEYTVFIRHDDSIRVASAKERTAIQQLKRLRFHETRNAPPVIFGAFTGATIGGMATAHLGKEIPGAGPREGQIFAGLLGATIFGTLGAMFGRTYKDVIEIKSEWQNYPKRRPWIITLSAIIFGSLAVVGQVLRKKR